jgi:hypothetical protein
MTRRSVLPVALFLAAPLLAACQPSVPDSGAGVGFQDYNSYIRQTYAPPPAPAPAPAAPAGAGFDPAAASAAIDRATGTAPAPSAGAPLDGTAPATGARPRAAAPAGIKVESGEVAGSGGHAGISDEQDFAAVSARETIESDAERIARNRAQYVVVQPKDLPVRPGDTGPNIVEFALATTHAPGVQMYSRRALVKKDVNAACAKFASPDLAQAEFLAKGGPDRDRMGLDPDGDGFACGWDPRPFRTALQ